MPDSESHWIKSPLSFSNSNCVEVASLPDGGIGIRDSKDSEGPGSPVYIGRMACISRRSAKRRIR
jgi:hypothetical protein